MRFIKMHGLGNDFIIVDTLKETITDTWPERAKELCHRRFGIGADGLVVLQPSKVADLCMRIFNPDGTEAEMCGNAIRCVALYAYRYLEGQKACLEVETLAGIIKPAIITGVSPERVRVNMGAPQFNRRTIPMYGADGEAREERLKVANQSIKCNVVSMGNPHCVVFVSELSETELEKYGPLLEKHELFPAGTNVEFVKVKSPSELDVLVWERGAGLTMACGTGACAVAVAAIRAGYCHREVEVRLPGGTLLIEWPTDCAPVYMTGSAEEVFKGQLL